jgi:hypothetical protein
VPPGGSCEHCGIKNPLMRMLAKGKGKALSAPRTARSQSVLGMVGNAVLAAGALVPVVTLPFVGAQNLFQNGGGDGTIIVGLAVAGLLLALLGGARWMVLTGGVAMAVVAVIFVRMLSVIHEMKQSLDAELAENPLRGLADVAMQGVQMQWGWVVLFVGALLVLTAGIQEWRAAQG